MSRGQSISSYSKLEDPYNSKPSTTLKSTRAPLKELKKGISRTASKPTHKAFLTQEEEIEHNFDETTMHTRKSINFNESKESRFSVSDKKVKNILGRLDSTIAKLNGAWKSCEKSFSKSSVSFFSRTTKAAGQTFLTDTNMDGSALSKKSGKIPDFSHMTMLNFSSPKITEKINQVVLELDLDPMSTKIGEHLWHQINSGRDYYNTIRDEIRQKSEKLRLLRAKEDECDIKADNTDLEKRVEELRDEIEKAKVDIEMSEIQTDVLNDMISQRKADKELNFKRFQDAIQPFVKVENQLNKDVDNVMAINQLLMNYMSQMSEIKAISASNKKFAEKIRHTKDVEEAKVARFDRNLELENVYGKKKKQFIIKTKKELEQYKTKEKVEREEAEKRELNDLIEAKHEYEGRFELLSTVSKNYKDKEEYVAHLDNLKANNEDLLFRVRDLDEELNLKRTIDLPTLQAELNEIKTSKDNIVAYGEYNTLRKEIIEKHRRNEEAERTMLAKEALTTNLIRGVMTVFNKVSLVKDYLNLSKLDEIKLKQDNLGDILMFSGEVLEILTKNNQDNVQIRSQPISLQDVSDDEP